ncbi:MAG TPA: ATP-binding protein [Candidatus Angelobacter sp.]|nr:ATP-binding protein [Candidatus Angelobacter sp.]
MPGKSRSISSRFTWIIMVVSAAALVLACSAFIAYDQVRARDAIVRDLSAQAQIVGANSAAALTFNDPKTAANTLAALRGFPGIISAGILTPDGQVFAQYRRDGGTEVLDLPPLAANQEETYSFHQGDVLLVRRIELQGKPIGSVYIRNDLEDLHTRLQHYALIAFLVLLVSLVAALLLSAALRRSLATPIVKLAETAGLVSRDKNYTVRAQPVSGFNEIDILVRAFNDMLEQIQQRDAELLKAQGELEQRVEDRTRQLIAANRELEAFSYSVSHDLRGPLETINGFTYMFLHDFGAKLDPAGKEFIQHIRGAAVRMGDLIDDLLKLSQVSSGAMHQEHVDLSAIARSIAQELQSHDPQRKVQFVIPESLGVSGDSRLLRIAMENLLRNAWKYTSKHPTARIEFGYDAAHGSYYVRDNGAGFNQEEAGRLFQPFQRLHSLSEFPGTGIGLATVQRVVHRHGGRIWAEGAVEQGATFHFTLNSESSTELRQPA